MSNGGRGDYESRIIELERKLQDMERMLADARRGGAPAPQSGGMAAGGMAVRGSGEIPPPPAAAATTVPQASFKADGASYRLGVDVGGTFTDLLLVNEATGENFTAKVPSTPEDSSRGVINGIKKVCETAGIDPRAISHVLHGTTVATNTVLTSSGAKVGLVVTKGYRQVLQIARSYVPGGLGGWVIYNKPDPLAPLELTIEADERMSAKGEVVDRLDGRKLENDLKTLAGEGIQALTVCLINAFANGAHEREVREIAQRVLPDVPVSISSEVVPEMQEYERTETTVANSYIRPVVSKYIRNLHTELSTSMEGVQLHVLRSDGGLSSVEAAEDFPVNLLMSGPAGGVAGAMFIAKQSGYENLLTFDMGGTSTDVALIQDGKAQKRRETRVGDVTVRASSIDVRTVGAGGGSIAYVPELTKALRVGPQSAGAVPGPAAYGRGGEEPTVTDANVTLGYFPESAKLGGDMGLDRAAARKAVQKIADGLDMPLEKAAEGIVNIVNENMFGALRLVSVEQGYDPRDFALIGFGGAGPLHVNALARLMGSWPAIVPPGPGVLCAYGDATTRVRDERSRTFIRRYTNTSDAEVLKALEELADGAAEALTAEGIAAGDQTTTVEVDLRYHGQGLTLTIETDLDGFKKTGLAGVAKEFDAIHEQMFTFALEHEHELVNLRAVVQGKPTVVRPPEIASGGEDASGATIATETIYVDGGFVDAKIYDRSKLAAGNVILGPAIVTEMDSTTLILPGHHAKVDKFGTLLIWPVN
ncbi:hydantoinase/oxoprolinase family protein [Marinibaculum pumilum]|uniref:Hydantoinase/oxoprolinase family protein n=1 Tax=Marinibaculum pumilum TaxID=1766165 RepID=A0ABV7L684_9PROT